MKAIFSLEPNPPKQFFLLFLHVVHTAYKTKGTGNIFAENNLWSLICSNFDLSTRKANLFGCLLEIQNKIILHDSPWISETLIENI